MRPNRGGRSRTKGAFTSVPRCYVSVKGESRDLRVGGSSAGERCADTVEKGAQLKGYYRASQNNASRPHLRVERGVWLPGRSDAGVWLGNDFANGTYATRYHKRKAGRVFHKGGPGCGARDSMSINADVITNLTRWCGANWSTYSSAMHIAPSSSM